MNRDDVELNDMKRIRSYLKKRIEDRRDDTAKDAGKDENDSVHSASVQSGSNISAATTSEIEDKQDRLMRKAIGQRTFDVDIGAVELSELIDEEMNIDHKNDEARKWKFFIHIKLLVIELCILIYLSHVSPSLPLLPSFLSLPLSPLLSLYIYMYILIITYMLGRNARFLTMTNLNLHSVPFFNYRHEVSSIPIHISYIIIYIMLYRYII